MNLNLWISSSCLQQYSCGSLCHKAYICGWGWCIRGCSGDFILVGFDIIHEKLTTIEGEALAIEKAM
ncbi:hypothetical protein A2U01_0094371, partial [Trifolium medium]|nr:hypothetical protein [Trifolium medium]